LFFDFDVILTIDIVDFDILYVVQPFVADFHACEFVLDVFGHFVVVVRVIELDLVPGVLLLVLDHFLVFLIGLFLGLGFVFVLSFIVEQALVGVCAPIGVLVLLNLGRAELGQDAQDLLHCLHLGGFVINRVVPLELGLETQAVHLPAETLVDKVLGVVLKVIVVFVDQSEPAERFRVLALLELGFAPEQFLPDELLIGELQVFVPRHDFHDGFVAVLLVVGAHLEGGADVVAPAVVQVELAHASGQHEALVQLLEFLADFELQLYQFNEGRCVRQQVFAFQL